MWEGGDLYISVCIAISIRGEVRWVMGTLNGDGMDMSVYIYIPKYLIPVPHPDGYSNFVLRITQAFCVSRMYF
jgi:hypothetical protein